MSKKEKRKRRKWIAPEIEHNKLTEWNWMVGYPEHLVLGENVDIGAFTYINARYGVLIGDNVQIGSHCSIYSHNTINMTKGRVDIHMGAMIGAHSVILPNVIIKKNQLIKAGSVVYEHDGLIYARTPTLYSFIDTILEDSNEKRTKN